ncbi:MAG: hypothetical protein IPO92_03205 [Saprospiraceae bacterium]|nr:hypothetical protein [Saprospiraceae bacterium]
MEYTCLKLCVLFVSITVMSCNHSTVSVIEDPGPQEQKMVSFLALGDSYTIGHNVPQESSFPFLLKTKLIANGFYCRKIQK